jgi:hypothetical protein
MLVAAPAMVVTSPVHWQLPSNRNGRQWGCLISGGTRSKRPFVGQACRRVVTDKLRGLGSLRVGCAPVTPRARGPACITQKQDMGYGFERASGPSFPSILSAGAMWRGPLPASVIPIATGLLKPLSSGYRSKGEKILRHPASVLLKSLGAAECQGL